MDRASKMPSSYLYDQ
ncbi:hypothetical protein ACVXW5_001105 [Escherichia coli]